MKNKDSNLVKRKAKNKTLMNTATNIRQTWCGIILNTGKGKDIFVHCIY